MNQNEVQRWIMNNPLIGLGIMVVIVLVLIAFAIAGLRASGMSIPSIRPALSRLWSGITRIARRIFIALWIAAAALLLWVFWDYIGPIFSGFNGGRTIRIVLYSLIGIALLFLLYQHWGKVMGWIGSWGRPGRPSMPGRTFWKWFGITLGVIVGWILMLMYSESLVAAFGRYYFYSKTTWGPATVVTFWLALIGTVALVGWLIYKRHWRVLGVLLALLAGFIAACASADSWNKIQLNHVADSRWYYFSEPYMTLPFFVTWVLILAVIGLMIYLLRKQLPQLLAIAISALVIGAIIYGLRATAPLHSGYTIVNYKESVDSRTEKAKEKKEPEYVTEITVERGKKTLVTMDDWSYVTYDPEPGKNILISHDELPADVEIIHGRPTKVEFASDNEHLLHNSTWEFKPRGDYDRCVVKLTRKPSNVEVVEN